MTTATGLFNRIQSQRNDRVHFQKDKSATGYADLVARVCLRNKYAHSIKLAMEERNKHPEKYAEARWDRQ